MLAKHPTHAAGSDPAFLPAMMQCVSDVVVRCAPDGRFLAVNRAALGLLGRLEADVVGQTPATLLLPDRTIEGIAQVIAEVVATGVARSAGFRWDAGDQAPWWSGQALPERDASERVTTVCFVLRDTNEPAVLDVERAARGEAEDYVQTRDRFVAVVSHELRTPLNSVQGWAHVLENQLALRSLEDPLALRALQGIRAGIAQQVQLVDDLLDTTMAMTGHLDLVEAPLVVGDLLAESVDRLSLLAREREVQVDFQDAERHRLVLGDDRKLARVFDHVLSNAIKFAQPGSGVTITIGHQDGYVVTRWRDAGEGFPTDEAEALFAPFRQQDDTDTRRSGGLGIGLTLAKLVVELHGGRIAIEPNGDGPGSTASISLAELPVAAAPAPRDVTPAVAASTGRPEQSLEHLDILVVDDQEEAREALRALLMQMGASVEVRDSCASALVAVATARRRPDAVVCDIAMPDEDGYVFVRRLREQEREAGRAGRPIRRIPVVALSAYAHGPAGIDAIDFDAYLDKPVSVAELLRGLARATAGN